MTAITNNRVFKYFRESKEELKKVSWPSQKDTIRYSVIVIVASIALGVYFGVLDYVLNIAVEALINL